jgi:hypothetical protein
MEIRQDMFGVTPVIGDIIVFNPPKNKGLISGVCVGFSEAGLPKLNFDPDTRIKHTVYFDITVKGFYTPKTGFVIHRES